MRLWRASGRRPRARPRPEEIHMRRPIVSRATLAAATALAVIATIPPAVAQEHKGVRYADIPEGAWSVVAEIRAKPGKEAALREATLPLIALVRSDPKNLVYFLQEDRDQPGHFVFYEVFATQADFE